MLASCKPLFSPTPDEPIVEHAIFYATCEGWPVLVVDPETKIPLKSAQHSNGLRWGQTLNADEIRRDFKKWPNANVGIATGEAAGFFVVETDTADGHGDGVDGAAALAALEAVHGSLPETLEAESSSGSIHRYFKHPGFKIKNSGSGVAPGVDVRGDGGMVVAVPSVKPGKGAYRWRNKLPIAEAPQWLLDKIVAGKEKPEPELTNTQQALATVRPPHDGFDDIADQVRRGGDGSGYIEAALSGEYEDVARASKGRRNAQLNDSSLKLGHYVGGGELDEKTVIDTMMDACAANGLLAEDGKAKCLATIASGLEAGKREPKGVPEPKHTQRQDATKPKPEQPPESSPPPIRATPFVLKDPTRLPRRQWLYGTLLLRKFVSATISPGSVGKSSLIAAEALAMASGKDLLGVEPNEPLRVWLWNLEDPQEETERKIGAVALHYELGQHDIGDRLKVDSGRDQKLVIATMTRKGAMIVQPVVDALVAEIIRLKIDVLIIDPFVSCHEIPENDNGAMDMVVKEWGKVADLGNCAVMLAHHTRKMGGAGGESEVTVDSGRGASSQTDACRVVRTLNRMTKEQSTNTGIENPWLYFRTTNGKPNLEPPIDKSDWYKLVSVDLGNGEMGTGDSIGVVTKWEFPAALAGFTAEDFQKVAIAIRGGKWRFDQQAKAWVGKAVAEALGLDIDDKAIKGKIKRALGAWYKAKSLVLVDGFDDKRKLKQFVEVAKED